MPPKRSHRQRRKAQVLEILRGADWEELLRFAEAEPSAMSVLVTFLLELDDLLRWRAIDGLGRVAEHVARSDLEAVRDLVRRQIWAMNDESGNIPWHAGEAIGEILFKVSALRAEFAPILFSHRHDHPFQVGVHWAMARLAEKERKIIQPEISFLLEGLAAEEIAIRGYSAMALGLLAVEPATPGLRALLADDQKLALYDFQSSTLVLKSIGQLAEEALREISSGLNG
jgi:HEAT repeat protein